MSNPNAEVILSTLSSETVDVLRTHFLSEAAATLTSGLNSTAEPAPSRGRPKGSTTKRRGRGKTQVTNDGTERNSSQFIRECKDSMSAAEVVEAATEVGLNIAPALVYNVRANAKKKAEAASDEKAEAAKKEETNKKRATALAKARAAKAAKK